MTDVSPERIRITPIDLRDPKIEDIIAQEQAMRRPSPAGQTIQPTPWYLSAIFYTTVAGAVGALLGWALLEPYYVDEMETSGWEKLAGYLLLPVVGGMTGLLVGGIEGLVSRHYTRALLGALIGFGVAFVIGLFSSKAADILFTIAVFAAVKVAGGGENVLSGIGFFGLVVGRSMAWALAGMTVALGPGLALRSKKLTFNGFLGGMLGGAVGGLFFDPANRIIGGPGMEEGAEISRCLGCTFVGAFSGLFVGLVEHFAKEAWLQMVAGPLAGKQFIVYKSPTVLGSSPKCEIYLFKDAGIEPRHAGIYKTGVRYEIEDYGTPGGTFVNGTAVKRQTLRDGDRIVLGQTALTFSERPREAGSVR